FNSPLRVGDLSFTTNLQYQALSEVRPNSFGSMVYGPAYQSSTLMKYNVFTGGVGVTIPAYGQKVGLNVSGGYDTLKRPDMTPFQYYPINPTTQTFDATAFLTAQAAFGPTGSPTVFYPNYVNMQHWFWNARATLPLNRDFFLIGYYSTQHYTGEYGTTLGQSISQYKNFESATLQYNIPRTNSSLSFVARNQQYVDAYVPAYNFGQNRQDINFTVRF
ncbi:MAG TPA: hypothetical protein VKG44_07170, partial [Candidatus Baltobacteraceae bacterium]|nr:hypothetical protein [Candidatus Baltobacteraceae bacterium]